MLGALLSIVFGFVLSLGPSVHVGDRLIHLPYYWLSRFLPGFHAVRVPCRFGFIVLFGVAILAGIGYGRALEGICRLRPADSLAISAALTAALLFVVFWEFSVDLHTARASMQPAPEYRFLSSQAPGSVTLELPTISWRALDPIAAQRNTSKLESPEFQREAAYVFASSFHWQPIMNGFSGHVSPVSYDVSSLAVELPSRSAVAALARYGLQFVILHPSAMPAAALAAWQNLPANSGLTQVASFPDALIYKLHG